MLKYTWGPGTHAISSQRILCQYLGIEFLQDIRSKGVRVELEGTLPYFNQMPQSWDIRQKANHQERRIKIQNQNLKTENRKVEKINVVKVEKLKL